MDWERVDSWLSEEIEESKRLSGRLAGSGTQPDQWSQKGRTEALLSVRARLRDFRQQESVERTVLVSIPNPEGGFNVLLSCTHTLAVPGKPGVSMPCPQCLQQLKSGS